MARTKKVTAPKAVETVKETPAAAVVEEVKAAEAPAKKAPAKKAAAKTTKAAETKKAPAKKTASKKTVASENIYIQQNGSEISTAALLEKAKADAGIEAPKSIDVYVRPEINMVYYVIDGEIFGNFELC